METNLDCPIGIRTIFDFENNKLLVRFTMPEPMDVMTVLADDLYKAIGEQIEMTIKEMEAKRDELLKMSEEVKDANE